MVRVDTIRKVKLIIDLKLSEKYVDVSDFSEELDIFLVE